MSETKIKEVIDHVNKRIDSTLCAQPDGTYRPYVCIICDRILKPSTLAVVQEEDLRLYRKNLQCTNNFIRLSKHHRVVSDYSYRGEHARHWMKYLLLSPRASYLGTGRGRGKVCGYSTCTHCKDAVAKKRLMPTYAIANRYYFGSPPDALACLNDVELALLTPMKAYGFVFTYSGGKQCNLKGVVSYFRVKEYAIARALLQLEVIGLNEHVVVIYTGDFTTEQKLKAKEKSTIRTDKVLEAVRCLVCTHRLWKNVDINKIRRQLLEIGPTIIDESANVESATDAVNSNIETTETFVAYFPDGTMKTVSGGQANIDEFKALVQRSKFNMDQVEFQCVLEREAAADFEDDNFIRACLLQFPYGLGGMNERRMKPDGSLTTSVNLKDYVRHLSYISQPHFHRPLFVLILYSIFQRQLMLRTSSLNVRGEITCSELSSALNADDVDDAVRFRRLQLEARKDGRAAPPVSGGTFLSNKYLKAIDAVTRALPHSNAAANRARTEGQCASHYFGFPTVFLSLSPDDESSFSLQVYTGVIIDDDTPIESLTDEQLAERAKSRRELRIRNPGLCAFNFEVVLEIVMEEIIGIDMMKKEVLKEGFFGLVEAAMVTIEEQGRKTLHAHIVLWIPELKDTIGDIQSKSKTKQERSEAKTQIATKLDEVSTTKLIEDSNYVQLRRLFKHDCSSTHFRLPTMVDDQQLRNLRHKHGCEATHHVFAFCESCQKKWTHEEIVELFLQKELKIPNFDAYPDNCKRLNAMCVQYQKPTSTGAIPAVVNAAYNTHFSFHTKTCFPPPDDRKHKRATAKRKRNCEECRMRLPDCKRSKACVNETAEVTWYTWDGTCTMKTMIEVNPRRGKFDTLQNVSCPVISESKLTCNSNVQFLTPGAILEYITKYISKGNQKSETEDYGRVAAATRKMLADERKHPDDKREAMRRILRASFAHNKVNVVGPSLASWLTRMGSRFFISTEFAWCPLRDLDHLLKKRSLNVTLRSFNNMSFFENAALHYLCRPRTLETTDVMKFYTEYEVRFVPRKDDKHNDVLPFENTIFFSHPSYRRKSSRMAQGVRPRKKPLLLKLHQWYFPDSATFNGSILNEDTIITPVIEQYCRLVLMLFLPFRQESDLLLLGSHTKRLRQCVKDKLIRESAFEYLQNVQNSRGNALRHAPVEDELARKTIPFQPVDDGLVLSDFEESDCESDDEQPNPLCVDDIINSMFLSSEDFEDDHDIPTKLDFSSIMAKGSKQCGFDNIADVSPPRSPPTALHPSFIRTNHQTTSNPESSTAESDNRQQRFEARRPKSRKQVVQTVLNFTTLRKRTFPTFSKKDKPVEVRPANGTARSIIDWGRKAKLDKNQRRTFEILTSTFVLTFYDDAYSADTDTSRTRNHRFIAEYRKLSCLSGRSAKKENLVSFVHGPGGAGKSTIVDLVILYAKEYCDNMNFPFTSQTIVVTALTGVAATILMGETTHRAVYINCRKELEAEQIDNWKETRLLIVDEVSFAAPSLFEKLDDNLRTLTGKRMQNYGGLNVVFSGDLQQLKPVRDDSICDTYCPHFDDWINCYIELEGKHRFKDDPEWGELLFRFRNGVPTVNDIATINERVSSDATSLPSCVRYATYTNKDRDAINTAIFSKYCSSYKDNSAGRVLSAVIVLSDDLAVKNGNKAYVAVKRRRNFWENCGEDDVACKNKTSGRVDPALKLFHNCPVMLTTNDNVKAGRANGTRARVDHVVLKRGETPSYIHVDGCTVPAVLASQIDHVQLQHENKSIQPQTFTVEPRQYSIYAYLPRHHCESTRKQDKDKLEMKIKQLPITSNTATTGHKLQGSGVDNLFVHSWHYKDNWPYVVLSRVRTISGLFLREPLSYDLSKYAMPAHLKEKIDMFRRERTRPSPTLQMYEWMESSDTHFPRHTAT